MGKVSLSFKKVWHVQFELLCLARMMNLSMYWRKFETVP